MNVGKSGAHGLKELGKVADVRMMKVCPTCETYNPQENSRCFKCGSILESTGLYDIQFERLLRRRHKSVLYQLKGLIYRVGQWLGPMCQRKELPYRYPWVAGFLALLPGLGQLYNRQYGKAAVFFTVFVGLLALVILTITEPYSNWLIALFLLFLLYSYQDAFAVALMINGQFWTVRKSLAFISYLLFICGTVFTVSQFAILPIGRLVFISSNTFAPTLAKGDRIVVDSLSYLFNSPRRGDIVYYRPTHGFKVLYSPPGKDGKLPEQSEPIEYLIRPRNATERIIGLPGDTVEQKHGVLYVNGEPLEQGYYPLVTDQILEAFGDFRLQVPEHHYCIIMSAVPPEAALIYKVVTPAPILEQGPELRRELQQTAQMQVPIKRSFINKNWTEACIVDRKDIIGRVLLIYHPPMRRTLLAR